MHRIIVTAQVENPVEWEKKFRTHGDLFRKMGAKAMHFGFAEGNVVAIYAEVPDLEKYWEIQASAETQKAMADDRVIMETAKVFTLDKELRV